MNYLPAFYLLTVLACSSKMQSHSPVADKVINVSTAAGLKAALLNARPCDHIILFDGIYTGNFVIASNVSGTANNMITLSGSRNAVLDGGNINTGYVLSLQANYWNIKGITIKNGLKGIMADGVNYNVIDSVSVTQIGEEGVHFRRFSSNNILQNAEINNTGLKTPDYGEGVYIGSAVSNWAKYTNGAEDRCDSNTIANNNIGPNCAAECIDVKEGTTGSIIRSNHFDATGITGANSADSWMDVKGNYTLIENNIGYNPQGSVLVDGFQVHCAVDGWGNYNRFINNDAAVNAPGYGFNIVLKSSKGNAEGNEVSMNNKVTNAAKGIANIPVTP